MKSVTPRAMLSSLPFVDMDHLTGQQTTTMILAPHPDDESLGCGGLIAQSCARGRPPVVVVLTDGTGSHPSSPSYPPARLRDLREREATKAVALLGLPPERIYFLRLRDGHMPQTGRLYEATVERVLRLFREHYCTTIFAPWFYDPHCDHQATQLVARAVVSKVEASLFSYPVWGWLLPSDAASAKESITGWRLDIRQQLARKRGAIREHKSQYSDLITDDPNGFRLPAELLSVFDQPFEVFLDRS
jgi:LmbE family N-acetylglucosaminyl deacetylase